MELSLEMGFHIVKVISFLLMGIFDWSIFDVILSSAKKFSGDVISGD